MATLVAPSQARSLQVSASSGSGSPFPTLASSITGNINANASDTIRVSLSPTAGFCIKSLTTEAGFYTYTSVDSPSSPSSSSSSSSSKLKSNPNLLEPTQPRSQTRTLQIPTGTKVFLNVAWEKRVPAPPTVREEVIRRAMAGADLGLDGEEDGGGEYYVPVVVSEPREDLDKSGKPSIVFDCVFSVSLKARCMKDREFKLYLIELALEHVEEKARMTLSRQVGTPNIASKGKLEPRTVLMPRALVHPDSVSDSSYRGAGSGFGSGGDSTRASPLVQEILEDTDASSRKGRPSTNEVSENAKTKANTNDPFPSKTGDKGKDKPKSILKPSSSSVAGTNKSSIANGGASSAGVAVGIAHGGMGLDGNGEKQPPFIQEIDTLSGTGPENENESDVKALSALPPLRWKWHDASSSGGLMIEVNVPDLTRGLHALSTLDIEPRRVLLHIPHKHFLDINLNLSDEQIGKLGAAPAEVLADGAEEEGSLTLTEAMKVDNGLLRVRGHNAGEALRLKKKKEQTKERNFFDVANARAEWRVVEKKQRPEGGAWTEVDLNFAGDTRLMATRF